MRLSPLLFASPLASLHYYGQASKAEIGLVTRQAGPERLSPHRISLPLDHNGETDATFDNRFWLNATYYEAGGPVIFFDVGEMDGQEGADRYLRETQAPSAIMKLAARYKGLAIAWEHRFYGESFPLTNPTRRLSPEWKYHTVSQALLDVVVFAKSFANETSSSATPASPLQYYAVNPSKVPWIAVAPSYPGARIAFLRDQHPDVFFAGWGSSVCSGAEVNSPGYYSMIQSTLPANCSADWAAVRGYVDGLLRDGSPDARAKLRFGGEDETNALVAPAAAFQMTGPSTSTLPFCDALETINHARPFTSQGVVATAGVEAVYEVYASIVAPILSGYKQSLAYFENSTNFQSWFYQECYEIGGFRIHDTNNPNSFVSSLVTEEELAKVCTEKFGSDFLPHRPKVENLVRLGGWDVNPSNFFFTDGEWDPWRVITPSWPRKQGTVRQASESIPKCNTRPPLERYFGKVYEGAVHMPDYRISLGISTLDQQPRDREIFDTSLGLFEQALDEWLPCFGKSPAGHMDTDGGGPDSGAGGNGDQPNNGAVRAVQQPAHTVMWVLVLVTAFLYQYM